MIYKNLNHSYNITYDICNPEHNVDISHVMKSNSFYYRLYLSGLVANKKKNILPANKLIFM